MLRRTIGMILGKEKKEEYNALMLSKNYVEVGKKYGKLVYHFSVSGCRRKKIWKELAKAGELDTVAQLYSMRTVKKAQTLNKQYEEYKANPNKAVATCKYGFQRGIRSGLVWLALVVLLIIASRTQIWSWIIKSSMQTVQMETEQEYAAELEAFDIAAIEYSLYLFDELFTVNDGLSDIQYFSKIMNDMWSGIEGYGEPQMNLVGGLKLDIVSENGVGVCRNMADYMASVIKSTELLGGYSNPRRIYVDMMEDGEFKTMSIERNIVKPAEEIQENEKSYWDDNMAVKYAANHVIVAIDYENKAEEVAFTLLIDPTNPAYGYLKDGEIVWINSSYDRNGNPNNPNPCTYKYKELADYEMSDNHRANTKAVRRSKHLSQKSEDYIWAHFDYPEQEKALEQVKLIDDQEYVRENYFGGAYRKVLDLYYTE